VRPRHQGEQFRDVHFLQTGPIEQRGEPREGRIRASLQHVALGQHTLHKASRLEILAVCKQPQGLVQILGRLVPRPFT
jgi:hypothetical protein